ncbi:AraC family transcriptional regulator [Ruegeria sp. HKCCE3926]|uniref:helix-turn-helix domain-containing protein n=1 Tax=Ruegeria sp. HKCCE3926 TaxID=2794831 RepID=UPI001AEA9263|nr:AraC family transcriptional regulator [Ruegeria sp. HKCCE3926]
MFGNRKTPKDSDLPLVRATVLAPVVAALRARGQDADDVFAHLSFDAATMIAPEQFLSHETVYAAFNAASEAEGTDFCTRVGQSVDLRRFLPKGQELTEAFTLGGLFTRFTQIVSKESNAVTQSLVVEDEYAYFAARRHFRSSVSPAQADGFMIGIWISLLHRVIDFRWDPREIVLQLANPNVLPKQFYGVTGIPCDDRGFSIRFPSIWLNHRLSEDMMENNPEYHPSVMELAAPLDFLAGFEDIVRSRLADPAFTAVEAARTVGLHPNTLNARLSERGETTSKVIARMKREKAIELLGVKSCSVTDTAQQLGFSDPTAFSRAFRRWTGQSPQAFKRSYTEPEE